MKTGLRLPIFACSVILAMPCGALAQGYTYSSSAAPAIGTTYSSGYPSGAVSPADDDAAPATNYTAEQLDQMLAPIALYPDPLIGQVLMASTYPLDVVEAYRWRQEAGNAGLQGNVLSAALDQQPWDPSVKALVAFPQVLKTMNDNLPWMEQLGDAFLGQQAAVMDSIQRLRQDAQSSGALVSTPQQVVSADSNVIQIQPADPGVLYVPEYNPGQIYGAWPYEDYPPYQFQYQSAPVYNSGLIGFAAGIAVVAALLDWDHWDWHRHRIDIDDRRFAALNRGRPPVAHGVWHHDPVQRRGVPYHSVATRARYQAAMQSPQARRSFRGYAPQAQAAPSVVPAGRTATPLQGRVNGPTLEARPQNHAGFTGRPSGARPAATPLPRATETARPQAPAQVQAQSRAPMQVQPQARAQPSQPEHRASPALYESFSRGPAVQAQSQRGSASRATPSAAPVAHETPHAAVPHNSPSPRPQRPGGGEHGPHDNPAQQRP